ncbi:MAG: ATP-binding cassette domain-containing protein [Hyphomicrobiales bacterium]|nr:ATP-binding cassette domain-containing protein [Hyphomicrobiales bacterium]
MKVSGPIAGVGNWENEPVLSVEHLTMRFGGLVAINDLSFDVGRGDITALIGPNGAGKTTVFNCVTGFYKPTEGRIVMRHGTSRKDDLVEQVTASGDQWRRGGDGAVFLLERMADSDISKSACIARTFQNIRLFGGMTALENLLVAQHNPLMAASSFTVGGIIGLPGYRKAEKAAMETARYWLDRVDLVKRADDPAADLPYGAQRRLEIARAMCTGPHLLCLDEPAAGLNPRESAELNALLQRIRTEEDTSVLLIEHDMGVVMEISDHIVVLDYGEKISDGDADFVRNDPAVIAAYLGVDDEEEVDIPEVRQDVSGIGASPAKKKAGTPAGKRKATSTVKAAPAAKPVTRKAAKKKSDNRPPRIRKPAKPDDLKRISGVGPKLEDVLNGLGIYKFDQVAQWKKAELDWVDDHLKFKGRIERDGWVKQAKALARQAAKTGGKGGKA